MSEAAHGSAAGEVHLQAAARVMGRRHDRDRFARDVDAELQALGMDVGKVLAHERLALVRDVEEDAIQAALLHLEVDGARHHVARSQLAALVVAGHEALAVGQLEQPAFSAHGFRDEETLGMRVVEAGGMELDELHVGHRAAGAPAHGDAVAGRGIGVRGVEVDLAGPAGGEDRRARPDRPYLARAHVEHVGAVAAVLGQPELAAGDEVDGDVPLEDLDVRVPLHLLDEGALHGVAGRVRSVDDAPVAVPALAVQVQFLRATRLARERHALRHEPVDGVAAALDHEAHRVVVAQAGTGHVRVAGMVLERVGAVEHGRDAALGIGRGPFEELMLGDESDAARGRQAQGGGQSRQPAADDEDVVGAQVGFLVVAGFTRRAGTICRSGSLLAMVAKSRTAR